MGWSSTRTLRLIFSNQRGIHIISAKRRSHPWCPAFAPLEVRSRFFRPSLAPIITTVATARHFRLALKALRRLIVPERCCCGSALDCTTHCVFVAKATGHTTRLSFECGRVVSLSDLFDQSAGGYRNRNKTKVEGVGLQIKKRNKIYRTEKKSLSCLLDPYIELRLQYLFEDKPVHTPHRSSTDRYLQITYYRS